MPDDAARPRPEIPVSTVAARTSWLRAWVDGKGLIRVASMLVFIVGWQIGSYFVPPYIMPGWGKILHSLVNLPIYDTEMTILRVLVSMIGSFIVGLGLSLLIFDRPALEAFFLPYVRLLMAVPAVCWVVFSILWFKGVEFRIFFVMFVTCMPVFVIDSLDAMKAVPADLRHMVSSFRPDPIQKLTKIMLPGIVPNLLTSWKINFTLAIRVVTIAELVGALSGIGHGLELAEEMFTIADVYAWTLILVLILLAFETAFAFVERRALRWRNA
jgi:ABC-type nitrate/sulfonate/bicarbonate transport system permease component